METGDSFGINRGRPLHFYWQTEAGPDAIVHDWENYRQCYC